MGVLLDEFKPTMASSIQELRRAGLKIDCFALHEDSDRTSSVTLPSTLNKPLSCPITVLCNDIWAQKMAATCPTTTLTAKVSEEDGLASEDIQQILSVSIVAENL